MVCLKSCKCIWIINRIPTVQCCMQCYWCVPIRAAPLLLRVVAALPAASGQVMSHLGAQLYNTFVGYVLDLLRIWGGEGGSSRSSDVFFWAWIEVEVEASLLAALSDHAYYLACGTEGMRELGLERVCSFRFQGHNTITTTAIERDVTVLSSTVKKELRAMISWPAVLSIHTQCCISSAVVLGQQYPGVMT